MNLFTLFGKIGLDDKEYNAKIKGVVSKAEQLSKKMGNVKPLKPTVEGNKFIGGVKLVGKSVDGLRGKMKINPLKPNIESKNFEGKSRGIGRIVDSLKDKMRIKPLKPDVEIKKFDGKARGVIKKADLIRIKMKKRTTMTPKIEDKQVQSKGKSTIKIVDKIKALFKKGINKLKPKVDDKEVQSKGKGIKGIVLKLRELFKKGLQKLSAKLDDKDIQSKGKSTNKIVSKLKALFKKGIDKLIARMETKEVESKGKKTESIVSKLRNLFRKGIDKLKIRIDNSKFMKDADAARAAMDKLKDGAKNVGSAINDFINKGIMAATAAVGGFIAVGVQQNAALETSKTSWTTLLGTQEKAVAMLNKITDYAAKTPFSKMGVDEMAKQLHNAGFAGDNLFNQLTKFGNMGSAFGIQEESLKEMVRQYGQVQMAGVAYTEDLNILQDRGIPIYKALSQALGVTVADIKKMASEGEITADKYNKAIDQIAKGTEGAMENQSKTLSGLWSTFKDTWSQITQRLSEPIFDIVKQGLEKLMPVFDKLNEAARIFGEKVKEGKPPLDAIKDALRQAFGEDVLQKIQSLVDKAKTVIEVIIAVKAAMIAFGAVSAITTVIIGIAGAFALAGRAISGVGLLLGGLPVIIALVVGAVVFLAMKVIENWDKIKEWTGQLGEKIGEFVQKCWDWFTIKLPEYLKAMLEWFAQLPGKIWEWLLLVINKIIEWSAKMWEKAQELGKKFLEIVIQFFKQLPGKLWEIFLLIVQKVIEWSGKMWDKAKELGQKFLQFIIDFIKQLPGKLWEWFSNAMVKTAEFVAKMIRKAFELGRDFIKFLIDFIKQLPGKLWEWFLNGISKASEFAGKMWEKAKELGKMFVQFLIDFIKSLPGKIWEWFLQTIAKAHEFGGKMKEKAKQAGKLFFDALVAAVKNLPKLMLETGKKIVSGIWDGISGMAGWLWDKLTGFVRGIKDTIMGMFKDVKSEGDSAIANASPKAKVRSMPMYASYGIMDDRNNNNNSPVIINQTINSARQLSPKEIGEETRKIQSRMRWRL